MNLPLSASNINQSPLFTPWRDPRSGVTSYVLTSSAAPWQQPLYFVNDGFGDGGRYYWFYCGFPPAGNHNEGLALGVADFAAHTTRYFPETQFLDASPVVEAATGAVLWCGGVNLWRRGPGADATVELVNRLPDDLTRGRRPWRVATHLTFSADGQRVNFDAEVGTDWLVGDFPLDGTPPRVWQKFDRCYNHAQFCPADAELQLIAQDTAVHPLSGGTLAPENRLWLIRRGARAFPVLPASGSGLDGHEWWSADGRRIWFVRYHRGVCCVALANARADRVDDPPVAEVWSLPTVSFAHASRDERLVVANCAPSPTENSVRLLNRATGRVTVIATNLPPLPTTARNFHTQAMPRFCLEDEFISYTTTVGGTAGVALVPVREVK